MWEGVRNPWWSIVLWGHPTRLSRKVPSNGRIAEAAPHRIGHGSQDPDELLRVVTGHVRDLHQSGGVILHGVDPVTEW